MSVNEVRSFLRDSAAAGESTAVAVLLRAWRSAPRAPGARFAAGRGTVTAGSISAGCVEADLRERLASITESAFPGIVRYGISDDDATAVGLSCGGEIEVLLQPHDPDDPAWRALERALEANEEVVLATGISDSMLGRSMAITPESAVAGSLGDAEVDDAVVAHAVRLRHGPGRAVVREVLPGREVFLEPFLPARRLIVVGATPIALALATLARALEIRVIVVDPRELLAERAQQAGVHTIQAAPRTAFGELGLDQRCAVAVVAHEERLDLDALEAALGAGAGYVGLLGGGRTQRRRREGLELRGVSADAIATIQGPIGLDISAESPAEIALSILAQVVHQWNAPARPGDVA